MTKKRVVFILGGLLSVLSFGALWFTLQGQNQPTATIKVAEPSQAEVKPSSEPSSSQESSSYQEEVVEDIGSISDNITAISQVAKGLNDFNIGHTSDYERIVEQLKSYNVTVDPGLLTPYGEFEYTDSLVFVATVEGYSVAEVPGSKDYQLTFTTRTAVSDNYRGHEAKARIAKDLRRFVKSNKYTGQDRDVTYRLSVSEDGKSAVLTLESGKWW